MNYDKDLVVILAPTLSAQPPPVAAPPPGSRRGVAARPDGAERARPHASSPEHPAPGSRSCHRCAAGKAPYRSPSMCRRGNERLGCGHGPPHPGRNRSIAIASGTETTLEERELMKTCNERWNGRLIEWVLSAGDDTHISESERREIQSHLETCGACRSAVRALKEQREKLDGSVAELVRFEPSPEFRARLLAAVASSSPAPSQMLHARWAWVGLATAVAAAAGVLFQGPCGP